MKLASNWFIDNIGLIIRTTPYIHYGKYKHEIQGRGFQWEVFGQAMKQGKRIVIDIQFIVQSEREKPGAPLASSAIHQEFFNVSPEQIDRLQWIITNAVQEIIEEMKAPGEDEE